MVASSCARVTNDGLTAVLVTAGVLAVMYLVDRPSPERALLVGCVSAAAILTKSPGALLLPVILAGLIVIAWQGRLRMPLVERTVQQ